MHLHITSFLRAAAIVGAVTLTACDPSVGPAAVELMPSANLTLKIENYNLNEWGTRQPGATAEWVTVSTDTTSFGGRPNVTRYVFRPDTNRRLAGDTLYAHIRENGDLEFLQRFEDAGILRIKDRWVTLPFGLKGSTATTALDTTFTRPGDTTVFHYRETWTTAFLGPETLDTGLAYRTVTRGDLATLKARVVQTIEIATGLPLRTPVTTTHSIWYSPKLGTVVKWETLITWPPGSIGPPGGGFGWQAVSYMQR